MAQISDPVVMCCGEAVTDRVYVAGAPAQDFHGGSAVNTAVALARLGTDCGFLGAISNDTQGNALHAYLASSGVDTGCAQRSKRASTIATITHHPAGPVFVISDSDSAGRMFAPRDLPVLADSVRALLFGGISLIPKTSGATFESLMAHHAPRHLIYLDLNIRPGLIDTPARHPYRARLRRMIALADIIKTSDEDMDFLDPHLYAGAQAIVLHTRGPKGVIATHHGKKTIIPAPFTNVADTLGAGDIFNAGALNALHRSNRMTKSAIRNISMPDLRAVLQFATRVASFSATRTGANGPTLQEVSCAR